MLSVWLAGEVCVEVNQKCAVDTAGHIIFQSRLNQVQRDIVVYVLGVLSAALTQILGYFFGSSQSSAKKTDILSAELDKSKG